MNKTEKQDLKDLHLMLIVFGVILCSAVTYCAGRDAGKKDKQTEIENRALLLNMTEKENTIVEKVIFGESQL